MGWPGGGRLQIAGCAVTIRIGCSGNSVVLRIISDWNAISLLSRADHFGRGGRGWSPYFFS